MFLDFSKVRIPAFIGDPGWQRRGFVRGSIVDISFGVGQASIPKGTRIEIQGDGDFPGDAGHFLPGGFPVAGPLEVQAQAGVRVGG